MGLAFPSQRQTEPFTPKGPRRPRLPLLGRESSPRRSGFGCDDAGRGSFWVRVITVGSSIWTSSESCPGPRDTSALDQGVCGWWRLSFSLGVSSPPAPEAVKDVFVFVNGEEAVAGLGEIIPLSVVIKDPVPREVNEAADWSSSDPAVATVTSSGFVTLRSPRLRRGDGHLPGPRGPDHGARC